MTTPKRSRAALVVMACALFAASASSSGCARRNNSPSTTHAQGGVIRIAHPGVTPFVREVVMDPTRLDADRELDAGRHPEELLAFLEVAPGLRFGEIGAGGGYTTELVARAVGERGRVYAENNRFVLERFAAKPWSDRLQRPAMRNVVRVDREFDDPFPPEARDLDGVYVNLFYHDTIWMGANRDRMNKAVFDALRPGGYYVIVDHAARPGSGTADAQTLHRIDEAFVIAEVERAGFKLNAVADFLRNPADKRDWNASPRTAGERRGTSDRFALQFVKPVRNTSPGMGG
ncbi:MAG TPA: SAM-dependent methyltransferase [Polyangia bacterium]|jgi:predicted methyltransferase|nr:SAM-dependent methyltransferase [Polyangia bacterium]